MKIAVITGGRGSGKSTLLAGTLKAAARPGLRIAGILAPSAVESGRRVGYDLQDLSGGGRVPLARRLADEAGGDRPVPFSFFPEGLDAGRRALSPRICSSADVIAVDEVGPLEIAGGGWAPCLTPLLELSGCRHVWVVRSRLLERIQQVFGFEASLVVRAGAEDAQRRLVHFCLKEAP